MKTCPITGHKVPAIRDHETETYSYETPMVGKLKFTDIALSEANHLSPEQKQILAGICRNRTINGEEPLLIKSSLLHQLEELETPKSFEEKARHLLLYFYEHGGREFRFHNMNSRNDSPICYSSPEEFDRIIKYLVEEEGWLDYTQKQPTMQQTFYNGLRITKNGIGEVEKGKPKMPLYGLISQEITTGNPEVDQHIEHARKLFFDVQSTFESKRTACETLSYVIEPLRNEIKDLFQGDTETFFRIVNDFNVRHNKEKTKQIQHEEQLEWIFYSLLNTVNTYTKLKKKLQDT